MKLLSDIELNNKKVLVRADLNVPIDDSGKITDKNRIKQFAPTAKYILEKGASLIVISHLGRPAGVKDPKASLAPVAIALGEILGLNVQLANDCIGAEVEKLASELQPGQVIMLENLRFHPGEKKNDPEFSRKLAKLADVYVNDAFATAHRAHASMVGVASLFQEKSAGLLMQKEIEFTSKALDNPKRPLCVILGGAKVSSKLEALINIAGKADKIIIGGAMANTFLAAQGIQMGRSLFEAELFPRVIELLAQLARRDCKLYLPVDFIVGPSLNSKGLGRAVTSQEIPADSMALDIGPATSLLYKEALQTAETIIWNGPMGAFENEDYANGTTSMCEHLATAHGLTLVGGGDTDAAIHKMELDHKFDYISTGGGAFLTLLEGKILPAIAAIS
ncbi:MAG: phosphoglycerate kinase [Bdellovibrionota bacterium]